MLPSDLTRTLGELRARIFAIRDSLDLPAKKSELSKLEDRMARPDFWTEQESARKVIEQLKVLKSTIDPIEKLAAKVGDIEVLLELAVEEDDAATLDEASRELDSLRAATDRFELQTLLSGPMDANNCYFSIQAGAGGTEACDWAYMLLRMYLLYLERAGYDVSQVDRSDGDEAGLRSVTLYVKGPCAYGYLSCERGVHRLVRISPFDANKRRHTSFAAVDVIPEVEELQVTVDWDKDVREDTFRASGAGGQHVNKTSSAIRLTHLPTGIVVQCQSERSQHQNRDQARKMLSARVYQHEERKRDSELAKLYGEKGEIAFGSQIRSYVLDDRWVKDLRTDLKTSDTMGVLDGDIQPFIDAQLRNRANGKK
ncbi:MAG: peptide chain release factor 2 [Phycisphaerae bacterium]|nr:peptide chain release factor 2 [Phycisphaerae bacterium]